ncbi:MAG: hypothetical protein ACYDFT_07820 [Thermoplasmata archaeon]
MRVWHRAEPVRDPVVTERIRGVEVPVLTDAKRRLLRRDVAGALRDAYPKLLEDLQRAYGVEFPPGYSHEEILARGFTEPMRPLTEFFDRLYRLYAPVRFGGRMPDDRGDEVLELLRSLYSPEPMWRLYLSEGRSAVAAAPSERDLPAPPAVEGGPPA